MAVFALTVRSMPSPAAAWRVFQGVSALSLGAALASLAAVLWFGPASAWGGLGLAQSTQGAWLVVLVQLLGTVVGGFSARYLQGEGGQTRYVAALAGVLASVHVLLLANHWLVLIAAWAAVGFVLQQLLCFYPDRPFAALAAHKKRMADRMADMLLLAAAAMAWVEVGSASFTDLKNHLAQGPVSVLLQGSAVCLVLAVVLRTALLPVHGWLIQVMEAPTPVSALLHAGVINLGAFVLIRLAPLLEAAPLAQWLLVVCGLLTAMLAGLVMLTRVSIKVRLAWSTVAQMGFMLLQCGLGLYSLALLHLLGHSLYKAHAFLVSSSVVRYTKHQTMMGQSNAHALSLWLAPVVSAGVVASVNSGLALWLGGTAWPLWWSAIMALAWAPLLWVSQTPLVFGSARIWQWATGVGLVALLSFMAGVVHALPLGVVDAPNNQAGVLAVVGMAALYVCLAVLQYKPNALSVWHRWSYAGFYLDEFYTRLALKLMPGGWMPSPLMAMQTQRDAPAHGT